MSTMTITPPMSAAAPVRVRAESPAASQVRLTRRGRFVIFLVALVAVLCAGIALGAGSVASERPGTPEPTRVVMVGSGDTLWGIASDLAEDGDVRAMVDRIERLNALDSALVEAGQRLRVPVAD
jgi:Tfp pilus assembly protein FimV